MTGRSQSVAFMEGRDIVIFRVDQRLPVDRHISPLVRDLDRSDVLVDPFHIFIGTRRKRFPIQIKESVDIIFGKCCIHLAIIHRGNLLIGWRDANFAGRIRDTEQPFLLHDKNLILP